MMTRRVMTVLAATLLVAAAATADGTVSLSLDSSVAGTTVAPGAAIDWAVLVDVSTGDNLGLALWTCDLVQAPANPELFDIPLASTIPAVMVGFDRPGGITNPGEGAPSGYVGVQRGDAGQMNLIQLGGTQNTFGQAGSEFGTDPVVDPAIGQGGSLNVVSGSFSAPTAEGLYTFSLQNGIANVLITIATVPEHSQVSAATVNLDAASFSFTVGDAGLTGDMDCDGDVDFDDIDPFVLALTGQAAYDAAWPDCRWLNADCDEDGDVDFDDIDPFVAILSGG